jgi:Putative beta barrel porin-7 (BBP7)
MRTGLPWLLGAYFLAVAPAFAQSPPSWPDLKNTTMPSPVGPAAPDDKESIPAKQPAPFEPPQGGADISIGAGTDCNVCSTSFTVWARAEYLLYWVKNTPMPVSLVTGSDPTNPTQELLNSDRSFGACSGMRFGMGTWFDGSNSLGMETSFFLLQRRTTTFNAASDGNGTPTLQFPFINQSPGAVGDSLMPITYPGIFAGGVTVASTLQLWGAEANGVAVLIPRADGFELTGLAGFRYVDLLENLNISTVSSDLFTTPNTVLAQNDHFGTRNQFYGGQLGAKLNLEGGGFSFDMTAKVALGVTHQSVDIQGSSTQTGPGGINGTFPGGFFTQTSNIGHFTANQFGIVPAVELKLRYFIMPSLNVFAGYDFMYMNSVVRPGNQVDRNINLTQSSVLGYGAINGPAFPAQQFNRTDFWAQGATFGFEFRY